MYDASVVATCYHPPPMLLVRCDAQDIPKHVPPDGAQLVYLDPPFAVGVAFGARTAPRETRAALSTIAYDDRWPSLDAYVAWLEPRLRAAHRILSPNGSMWLHLDYRAVHEAKILSDAIFGRDAFAGEIIWVPGNGAKGRRSLGVTHQTILVYAKGPSFIWNGDDPALRAPYAKTSLAMHFKAKDDAGRRFRERTINGKTYRYYADIGRALGSVWSDCPAMVANTPLRKETTGYPTQKPLKLLDRIVRAATLEGGLVVDPFCGSGTTLVAAARLKRRFIGADIGTLAISTSSARLRAENVELSVFD